MLVCIGIQILLRDCGRLEGAGAIVWGLDCLPAGGSYVARLALRLRGQKGLDRAGVAVNIKSQRRGTPTRGGGGLPGRSVLCLAQGNGPHEVFTFFEHTAQPLVLLVDEVSIGGALTQRRHLSVDLLARQCERVALRQHLLKHAAIVARVHNEVISKKVHVWALCEHTAGQNDVDHRRYSSRGIATSLFSLTRLGTAVVARVFFEQGLRLHMAEAEGRRVLPDDLVDIVILLQ